MYLRETRQKRADGSYLTHLQLAESSWDPEKRQSKIRVIYNCGRAEDPAVAERMRRLAHGILRRCSPDEIVTDNPDWQVVDAWAYGDLY
ncbi:MAG: IS1634 family transposase, partial [Geminicoccaceae bacterium]